MKECETCNLSKTVFQQDGCIFKRKEHSQIKSCPCLTCLVKVTCTKLCAKRIKAWPYALSMDGFRIDKRHEIPQSTREIFGGKNYEK